MGTLFLLILPLLAFIVFAFVVYIQESIAESENSDANRNIKKIRAEIEALKTENNGLKSKKRRLENNLRKLRSNRY